MTVAWQLSSKFLHENDRIVACAAKCVGADNGTWAPSDLKIEVIAINVRVSPVPGNP